MAHLLSRFETAPRRSRKLPSNFPIISLCSPCLGGEKVLTAMSDDKKFSILVVDDERAVLTTYGLILSKKGYDVETAI